jgi:hypothetical protein
MKLNILIMVGALALLSLPVLPQQGAAIRPAAGRFELLIDGKPAYIKGVGGTNRLDIAAGNGANAFRTWGGTVESIKKDLEKARVNNMYIMQGVSLTKDSASYLNEEYKAKVRSQVRELAETFKDEPHILSWGLGNEIDHRNQANHRAAWQFVDELAQLIKSIDKRHLVSTVITHSAGALDSVAKYVPNIDYIGINSYGAIGRLDEMVEHSAYKGPYMVTEWGPSGFWEVPSTQWRAPIEQTSEEKRLVYEERYNKHILASKRCLGSFVFLWGQKEERTPTWFSMFAENNVEGLPLKGEKTPMVEAMQRVWTGKEPSQTSPVLSALTLNGKKAADNIYIEPNAPFKGEVTAVDREEKKLTCVWEVLKEATQLGSGGSYEPRPERVGKVVSTDTNTYVTSVDTPGNYRMFVYVLDNAGFVATANIPFSINTP